MKRFKHILCVLEADASSELAWERAVALADSNQAALTVATVIPRLPSITGLSHAGPDPVDLQSALRQQHEARLASLTAHHRTRASIPHTVLTGTSFLEIIREVLRGSHDLVIKCPESPDWLDRFFAGDDMQLLRQCPCPVWFVKPDVAGPYKRILAAVDVAQFHPPEQLERHRQLNLQVLEMAASLALAESAELHVVHAWEAMTELAQNLAVSASIPKDRLASGIEQERLQHRQQLDRLLHDIGAQNPAVGYCSAHGHSRVLHGQHGGNHSGADRLLGARDQTRGLRDTYHCRRLNSTPRQSLSHRGKPGRPAPAPWSLHAQIAVCPPSITSAEPVTNLVRCEVRD